MIKKLTQSLFVLMLITQQIQSDTIVQDDNAIEELSQPSDELDKINAKKKRRNKIIIATAVGAALAAGATLALVNFAPDHCPTVIRKYTPNWLILNSAQKQYYKAELEALNKELKDIQNQQNTIQKHHNYSEEEQKRNKAFDEECRVINEQIEKLNESLKDFDEEVANWQAMDATVQITEENKPFFDQYDKRKDLKKELQTKKKDFKKELEPILAHNPSYKELIEKEKANETAYKLVKNKKDKLI